jgi:hypothetical protein
MNVIQSKTQPAGAKLMHFEPVQPALCALPDFVKIPAVPGLPTELTGVALRNALQARADSSVSVRRG